MSEAKKFFITRPSEVRLEGDKVIMTTYEPKLVDLCPGISNEKFIELDKIGKYLIQEGYDKVQTTSGVWLTHKALQKEKEDFVQQLLAAWKEKG